MRPRRTACVRRMVQNRFDLRFPAAAALPTSNRPSRCQPGSAKRLRPQARAGDNRRKAAALRRRQWGARKEKQGAIRRPPPKAAPTPPTAGKHLTVLPVSGAPGTNLQVWNAPSRTARFSFWQGQGAPTKTQRSGFRGERKKKRSGARPARQGGASIEQPLLTTMGGCIPVTGLPVQIFTACPAPAAPARYRAGPTG